MGRVCPMVRSARLGIVLLIATIGAGCSDPKPKGQAKVPTSGDNLKAYREIKVPGVELFYIPDQRNSVGVLREGGDELRGKEAFHRVKAISAAADPSSLAHLAMLFLDDNVAGSGPWFKDDTAVPAEELALAKEPSISKGVLEYWRRHEQTAGLVRCRVALESATIECKAGAQIAYGKNMATDPMVTIDRDLARGDISSIRRGVVELDKLGTAEAVARLTAIALNHKMPRARSAATKALATAKGDGVTKTLARILLLDGFEGPRRQAALSLGERGDPDGREALEKAEGDDQSGKVRGAATHALSQLKK